MSVYTDYGLYPMKAILKYLSQIICFHFSSIIKDFLFDFGIWLRTVEIRQSTIWYTGSLRRRDKRLIEQVSDVSSIIFFIITYRLELLKTLYFYYIKK